MEETSGMIAALRRGDEAAYVALFDRHHAALVRTALIYVRTPDAAEEVAQQTWMAVLKGIDRFEGRSSLKTWLFSILVNRARTYAQREGRFVTLDEPDDPDDPAVTPDHFYPDGHDAAHHWVSIPNRWADLPEDRLLSSEVLDHIRHTIDSLPPNQRLVITLRDIDGLSSEEVCNILDVSDTNQRVLLHRARGRVRQALESYFRD